MPWSTLPPPPDSNTPSSSYIWGDWFQRVWKIVQPGALVSYTSVTLPASATSGSVAYASNGRKSGEAAGSGTGVPVYFSSGHWRTFSNDATVTF